MLGTIACWAREDEEAGDEALFRCRHDDGDQEDLDEGEAVEGVACYRALRAHGGPRMGPGHPCLQSVALLSLVSLGSALPLVPDSIQLLC